MRFQTSVIIATVVAAIAVSADGVGHKNCQNNNIALTFDDGFTQYTRSVVDQLVAAGQHATFCINVHNYGERIEFEA
jgi:peptidoglycan/xylan/chitin deacetylase (PgdA/CDA1 family)